MNQVVSSLRRRAGDLGFLACGITDLSPIPHGEVLTSWLEQGYAGTMRYLHRQAARRREPARILEGARTAVVILDVYAGADDAAGPPPRIARYARGRDYHLALIERLEQLAEVLREGGAAQVRCYADAGPVPERELAQRAGLGWIGKNTMLIRPGAGSWFFIGSILTDLSLPADKPFEADRCGTCTRCLDACPTGAFPEPRVLDATRCISYLTIEYRGEFEPDTDLHGWAFGCDICNEVCPWNVRFAAAADPVAAYRGRAEEPGERRPDWFDHMSPEEFESRYGDTPLERPGLAGMRRNWHAVFQKAPARDAGPGDLEES